MARSRIQCTICGLHSSNEGRGLCKNCWAKAKYAGTLHEYGRDPSVQEKIREEWPHFTSLLGDSGAVYRLARAFGVDEIVVRKAVWGMREEVAA